MSMRKPLEVDCAVGKGVGNFPFNKRLLRDALCNLLEFNMIHIVDSPMNTQINLSAFDPLQNTIDVRIKYPLLFTLIEDMKKHSSLNSQEWEVFLKRAKEDGQWGWYFVALLLGTVVKWEMSTPEVGEIV